jgi:hypothetical protein
MSGPIFGLCPGSRDWIKEKDNPLTGKDWIKVSDIGVRTLLDGLFLDLREALQLVGSSASPQEFGRYG